MNKVYLGLSILLTCSVLGIGQVDKSRKSPPVADSEEKGKHVSLMSGTRIDAELQKTIDVNNARVGDSVVLKTTKTVKQDGEVIIPKGTNVIGRITEVQRRTKENSRSRIGMIIDRIQGRDLSAPLSVSLVSITNAATRASLGDSAMMDTSGSSQTTASGNSGSSGGLLGGVGSTVGSVVNTTTQTVGTVTGTVAQTAGGVTNTAGRTLNGIEISAAASGSANSSTTLSSPNKNLRVEKGATFNLQVQKQASAQE